MGIFGEEDAPESGYRPSDEERATLTGSGTDKRKYRANVSVLGLTAGRTGELDPNNPEVKANVENGNLVEATDDDN